MLKFLKSVCDYGGKFIRGCVVFAWGWLRFESIRYFISRFSKSGQCCELTEGFCAVVCFYQCINNKRESDTKLCV